MTWALLPLAMLTGLRVCLSLSAADTKDDRARQSLAQEAAHALVLSWALVFLVVRPFMLQAFYVPSGSMQPTLRPDDRILVDKLAYRLRDPSRDDVVVFRAPQRATGGSPQDEEDFVKRVIGLPGDMVEVHGGSIYVNGRAHPDVHPAEPPEYEYGPVTVPPGCLFVMGDNHNHSNDSHRWGTLDRGRLIGRAVVVFWPPSRAGAIR